MYEQVIYDVDDPIATIRLNRPERLNAWTQRMDEEFKHALAEAERDPSVVAIIVTGSGRGFCAGADMEGLKQLTEGERATESSGLEANPGDATMPASFRGAYSYLYSIRKPILAAVNGPAAGLGFVLMLFCDMRFASDRAKFTTAFSRRGLVAEFGIGWTLPRLVGTAHALDLLCSARKIDAAEAERIGLVNRVLPHDELMPHVRAFAEDLGQNCSPASMAVMKRQVYTGLTQELGEHADEASRLMEASFERPDFKEGVSSYVERRPPRFPRL